jgi:hypothetical protein
MLILINMWNFGQFSTLTSIAINFGLVILAQLCGLIFSNPTAMKVYFLVITTPVVLETGTLLFTIIKGMAH